MVRYISYLQISRKPIIQLGGKYYTIFSFEFGVAGKLVGIIKMCLNETYNRVRIGKNLSDKFTVQNGLKQEMLYHHCFSLCFGICHQECPRETPRTETELDISADDVNIL
jgi:hypothetical protein